MLHQRTVSPKAKESNSRSELLEPGHAENRVKALAIDEDGIVSVQIGRRCDIVILVTLITFERAKFDAVELTLHDLLAQVLVISRQQHMDVRTIRRTEISQAQIFATRRRLINGGPAAGLMRFAFQRSGIKRLRIGGRSEGS